MGCISLFSLIRCRQGNEILLVLKHYDLWNGSEALVACTVSMSTHICLCVCECVCPCVERLMCACLRATTLCMCVRANRIQHV